MYSRTPFLMERSLLLFRRGPSKPILWDGPGQSFVEGHPKITSSVDLFDWLPEECY